MPTGFEWSRVVRGGVVCAVLAAVLFLGAGATLDECSSVTVVSFVATVGYVGCIVANVVTTVAGVGLLVRGGAHGQRRAAFLVPLAWLALVVAMLAAVVFCVDVVG
jgi:hypothetical protein